MVLFFAMGCTAPTDSPFCGGDGIESQVALPEDEQAHQVPMEWWYWTGHLVTSDGRWFGFEHVFFLRELGGGFGFMAHSALTNESEQIFLFDQAFGAWDSVEPSEGFSFALGPHTASGFNGIDVLHSELDGATFDLTLTDIKGPVLQHENGYHEYSFGGYTYYYSRPRMDIAGTINLDGVEESVTGQGWFDRQWGALESVVDEGWDWFSIQLDSMEEIMLFVSRTDAGAELVGGSYVDEQCAIVPIGANEFTYQARDTWVSPHTGGSYPLNWDISTQGLDLQVNVVMEDQELWGGPIDYWEGAAHVTGDREGRAYIELTGYAL